MNENYEWFTKLENSTHEEQIQLIELRLIDDIKYIENDSAYGVVLKGGLIAELKIYCRPFIRVNGTSIFLENSEQINKFVKILTNNSFKKIDVVNPADPKNHYGKEGLCGLILFTTKDKKVWRQIKALRP